MNATATETAVCRRCKRALIGKPYRFGGHAYDPRTMEQVPVNHFGGYACSRECDVRICLEMLADMPGGGGVNRLDSICQRSVDQNWPQD